jgi:NADH:ubiquinone reductase (H+-translocating)
LAVVVVGGGLTGIEAAAEMPGKLRTALAHANQASPFRVILADHHPLVGSYMGEFAWPIIAHALALLGIEMMGGIEIGALTHDGIMLRNGEMIPAATVVWCAGMRANPLTAVFGVETDLLGRLAVDQFMRVEGVANVFAAGDAAWEMVDDQHASVMSCQHSRPMGRFAGHNVVADLFGLPMLPLRIESYVTILDLGPWGAVYTEGWDRRVVSQGDSAKRTKQMINGQRIYPPMTRNRADILAAAEPLVQKPPEIGLA